jgi:tetratricopeptide (TPR) repeat protein
MCRDWLAVCHAALGDFADGITCGEEAARLAEAADHPYSRAHVYGLVGRLYVDKGDLSAAIPLLERGLEYARNADIPLWAQYAAVHLGYAYALSGRPDESLPLFAWAIEGFLAMKDLGYHSIRLSWWGEGCLLVGRLDEALDRAERALEAARAYEQRGSEAWALRLLGEIAARQGAPQVDEAEGYYRQALALAEELGMRPLEAHCHLGLGALYRRVGRADGARARLARAVELYRSMDMALWLPRAEDELATTG